MPRKIALTIVAAGFMGFVAFMGGNASIARAGGIHSTDVLTGSGDALDSDVVLVQGKGKGKGKGKGPGAGQGKGKGPGAGQGKGKGPGAGQGRGGRGGSGYWRGGPGFWLGPLVNPWDE